MKLIPLSKKGRKYAGKYFAKVDDADYESLNRFNWSVYFPKGRPYAARREHNNGKSIYILMHRFLMNPNKNQVVDHSDRDTLNYQRDNLRVCTQSENCRNSSSRHGSSSKYLGVIWDSSRNKWRAEIQFGGKKKYLGRFVLEDAAAMAYDNAARKIHGQFANPNFH